MLTRNVSAKQSVGGKLRVVVEVTNSWACIGLCDSLLSIVLVMGFASALWCEFLPLCVCNDGKLAFTMVMCYI